MDRSKRAIRTPKRFEDEAFDTPEPSASPSVFKVKLTTSKGPKISLPSLTKARETPKSKSSSETTKEKVPEPPKLVEHVPKLEESIEDLDEDVELPVITPVTKQTKESTKSPKEVKQKESAKPKEKPAKPPSIKTAKETPKLKEVGRPKEVAKVKDTTPKPLVVKPIERDGPLVYRPKMKRPRTPPIFEDVVLNLKLPFWDARTAAEQHENDEICELVHCHCGINEEIGWIIQCETCLTWQHSHCLGIEQPQTSLDGYTCRACSEPKFARESMRWAYDQEWLTKGVMKQFSCDKNLLPADKVRKLQQINQLIADTLRLQRIIHSLRVKSALHERVGDDDPELKSFRIQNADGTSSFPKANLKLDMDRTEEFVSKDLVRIEQQLDQIDDGHDSQLSIELLKNDLCTIKQFMESKIAREKPRAGVQVRSPLNEQYARLHESNK